MKNGSGKNCRENQNIFYVLVTFFNVSFMR